jgi:hypothetical protein
MRFSIRDLEFAGILENMFASRCALCKFYDMVASIRLTTPDQSFSLRSVACRYHNGKDVRFSNKVAKDAKTVERRENDWFVNSVALWHIEIVL